MSTGPPADPPAGPVRHPYLNAIFAIVVAGLAAYAVARIVGLHQVGRAFGHLQPRWLAPEAAAQLLGVYAYVAAYRAVVRQTGDRRLTLGTSIQLVLTGFGPLSAGGGLASDERSLQRLGLTRDVALLAVLVLSGVEVLSLVWIAFAASVVALAIDPALGGGLVWPWLVAVPIGTAIAIAISRRRHPEAMPAARPRRRAIATALDGVLHLARRPRELGFGWPGIIAYWVFDMAALGFALRTFGVSVVPEAVVLAYATGYLVSRRTLPLGGAGFVEFVLTFSLYWVHVPLARALGAVILYRAIDLGIAALRATVARQFLESALAKRDQSSDA